ncbi:uncharacterized protein RAG0_17818 [Rhynchosporium agropyri]|uniref:DUF7587 domain-containing protein n=1 Tax=Rhynchosporium agropyri TaxID=914238 RepID=A0A1E1LUA8_9HELO|nr:uncharacterized protein RAG0_17818 [Rhynchosporium agropyri]
MAHPEIADALQALSISNPEYRRLFCPDNPELFDDIPRYLFRVVTPKSRGTTDKSWTRSMDATDGAQNSRVDIFARENKIQVASMLNRHLQWWKGDEDNFVSWTSSLLFALVYIFHLHANSNDRSPFDDINVCIIDTNQIPKAVFLRDMDLIKAYSSSNKELAKFQGLRETKEWYFGEYLSQDVYKKDSSPLKTKFGAWSRLPEVEQFGKIMREVYKGFCVEKLRNYVNKAETQLRLADIIGLA